MNRGTSSSSSSRTLKFLARPIHEHEPCSGTRTQGEGYTRARTRRSSHRERPNVGHPYWGHRPGHRQAKSHRLALSGTIRARGVAHRAAVSTLFVQVTRRLRPCCAQRWAGGRQGSRTRTKRGGWAVAHRRAGGLAFGAGVETRVHCQNACVRARRLVPTADAAARGEAHQRQRRGSQPRHWAKRPAAAEPRRTLAPAQPSSRPGTPSRA